MEIYIFLIIGALLFGGLIAYSMINLDAESNLSICIVTILIAVMSFIGGYTKSEKDTAIKCSKDNNPYKIEIVYELKDSVYIPKDTIYVLK